MIGRVLAALVALLVGVSPAAAKTLYVNPTHASDSDATTYANNSASLPWTTLGRAVWGSTNVNAPVAAQAAQPGDLILVLSGGSPYTTAQAVTTPERYKPLYNPVNEGTSAATRITVRCVASFAAPTVVAPAGCDLRASAHSGPVFGFYQRDYITWDGFKVNENFTTSRSDTGPVVAWEMTGGELLNGEIVGITTAFNDNHCGIRLENADNTLVQNWLITGINDVQTGENSAGLMLYYSSNITIERVTITGGSNGIFVKGDNEGPVTVRRNLIHTQGRGIYAAGSDAVGGAAAGMYVYENILYGLENPLVFVSYDTTSPVHVYMCNNTARALTGALNGALRFAGSQITGLDNVRIVGNIFVDGAQIISSEDQAGTAFAAKAGPDPSALEIEHNVYHGYTSAFSRIDYTNRTLAAWKTFTGTDAASPLSVEADPLFLNKTGHDYRINSGSPARLGAPDVCDIDGDTDVEETVDAGARQFAANGAPIQIGYSTAASTAPTVTSVAPTSGPTTGGTLLTITGTNFAATPTITVGGSVCTSPNLISTTQVTCTAPARAAGVVSIVVTNPNAESGTGTNLYTYTGTVQSTSFLQTAEDATDQASGDYSFTSQSLGVAAVDRMITVVSLARKSASGSCATPAVTIAAITATSVVTSINGAFTCNVAAIHKALVPNGTTGTITVNYPAAMLHAHIAVYRTTGPYAIVATATGSSIADDPTGTLTIEAGGYAIGGSLTTSDGTSASWSGLTETFDEFFTGGTVNRGTGGMLIPATVQNDLPITVDWATASASVGVWAAWEPYVAATSPTHFVTPTGNTGGVCSVGDPCTLTRAFALAGGTTIPPGSWVSVAAGIYNQAGIVTTGGGVPGAMIRFVGAGDNTTSGSRLTGTRTAFPAASWSLCPSATYSYCATFDDVANYNVGIFAQRPGPLMTTPWVPIMVDDRQIDSGWAPSGRAFELDEPVSYTYRTSPAAVELQHCTFFHDLAANTLYMHPCREGVPTNGDQYYAGPVGWGTVTFSGSGDYISFENFSIEHTGTNPGILILDTATGTNVDNLRFLATRMVAGGRNSTGTDLYVTESITQGEPHAECYSLQYGGTGLNSRSCWNAFADEYGLTLGVEQQQVTYNQTWDRVTVVRGWNGIAITQYNTLNHALVWGVGNHATIVSGHNMTIRNSVFLNSQDSVFMADEDWTNHVYEHNIFQSDIVFYCGRSGSQNSAICPSLPTGWTVRYNIIPAMIDDWMNEQTQIRNCNVWMSRVSSPQYLLRIVQVGGSNIAYDTLAEIQGSGPHDDNSISYPSGKWYDSSIFANWSGDRETWPIDLTLTPTGGAQLTACGVRAGPDTLTTGEAEPSTAVRIRFRQP